MNKVLGLSGSPRRPGNCEMMIKEISRNIELPHELELIRLNDFDIMPCRGCYKCLFNDQQCVLNDDFNRLADVISGADALIVATPTYFLGANAGLKKFLDRGLALFAHLDKLWAKPAVGVGIAGIEGKEGYTLLNIESFLKMMFAEIKKCCICYGALPGEVMLNTNNKGAARELAQALFKPLISRTPTENTVPACPLCGGSTFRFLGGSRIRCMLCSNAGTIDFDQSRIEFHMTKDDHQFFLSKPEAKAHKEWLLQMKSRYLAQKDQLKAVCKPYLKEGHWIKK